MRNKLFGILSFVSICSLFSCTKEVFILEEDTSSGIVNYISVNLPDPGEMDTRSTFVIDNTGVHVFWADKDTIGIFPSSGDQVSFPMISGAGSTSANFDGGSWGLKDNNTYSAYYPFSRKYFSASHNAVRLTWEGQIQTGNNDGSHLGSFDYLASGASSPNGQYLNINFIRLGAIACFKVLAPQPGKYTTQSILPVIRFPSLSLGKKKALSPIFLKRIWLREGHLCLTRERASGRYPSKIRSLTGLASRIGIRTVTALLNMKRLPM